MIIVAFYCIRFMPLSFLHPDFPSMETTVLSSYLSYLIVGIQEVSLRFAFQYDTR